MNVPLFALNIPGVVVHASRADALKAHPDLADYSADQPPKNWEVKLGPGDNPDDPFPVHNLHLGATAAVWSFTYLTKGRAATLNIPPDSTGVSNPPVYPPAVPVPMVYEPDNPANNHLPAKFSILPTPFGMILSDSAAPVDPSLANLLVIVQRIDRNTTPKV